MGIADSLEAVDGQRPSHGLQLIAKPLSSLPKVPDDPLGQHAIQRYNLTSKISEEKLMPKLATTKMSSKGQVVIPEDVRSRLGLEAGEQFIVVGDEDVVILKRIAPPSMRDFDALVARARKQARNAGMKRSDVGAAVRKVRKRS